MLRKTRHIVNNNHVRYAIINNILPRLFKGRIENKKESYSPYIKKKITQKKQTPQDNQ